MLIQMRTRSPRLGGEEGRGREELGTGVGLRGARRMTVRARRILTTETSFIGIECIECNVIICVSVYCSQVSVPL